MNLNTAIELAVEEAVGCKVCVKVVKNPRQSDWKYFPCRREWLETAGEEYKVVAEVSPNGKICIF
jgi:hypothetical protein